MSFDLILMYKSETESWDDALERAEGSTDAPTTLSSSRVSQWEAVAAQLVDHGYQQYEGPGFIELTHPEMAIQIHLSENEASVAAPYWYQGKDAGAVLGEMVRTVAVIQDASGWALYDPQAGAGVTDVADLMTSGTKTMERTARFVATKVNRSGASRPWWKFWVK